MSHVGLESLINLHFLSHYKVAKHDVDKKDAESLAVKTVHPPSMAWKHRAEVFNIVSPFEARSKETCERSNQRGEQSKNYTVKLSRHAVEVKIAKWAQ